MKNVRFHNRDARFALLFLCLISFGLLIPWLGFFWDDWPSIWFLHFFGPSGFVDVFASDRPLLGRLFWVTTTILGESMLGWQVFGFITRWLCSLALLWTLRALWPDHFERVMWVALLFAVYPGFEQQFIAVTYSHVFIILTIFIISLGTTVYAIRKKSWFWALTGIALVGSAYSMFSVEYFFGLELFRPVFIWLALEKSQRRRFLRTLLHWLPYLVLMLLFLIWRIYLQETPRGQVQIFEQIQTNPVTGILQLTQTILTDITQASLLAWAQTLNFLNLNNFGILPTLLYIAIVAIASAIAVFFLLRFRQEEQAEAGLITRRWDKQAILIGLYGLLIAGWPFWTTNLPIGLEFPWDRFTITMMIGASLLVVGLVDLLIRPRLIKIIALGLLIGLAVGYHFQNANLFRREWAMQKAFFWQLTWRAPDIQPGTTILTSELPFKHYSDNSLTAPLNWIYAPESLPEPMPYLVYSIESRLGGSLIDFKRGVPIEQDYRATSFSGSTSQALVLYYLPPGCVQILDPQIHARLPQKPKYISEAMALSDVQRIVPNPRSQAKPPEHIFGQEPDQGWCYFFEQADLARQLGDWDRVVDVAEQAFSGSFRLYPVNAPELLPFIEGYAHHERWEEAYQRTDQAFQLQPRMNRILCDTWDRIESTTPPSLEKYQVIERVRKVVKCKAP